jgi:hypothetical protein
MGYVVSASTLTLVLLVGLPSVPHAAFAATPVGTSAIDCVVAARAFEEIAVLASTPTAPAPETTDPGNAASDDVVVAALTETVTQAVACANANDVLRSLSLFTDRYVAERFGADHPDDLGSLEAALSRTPVPAVEEDLLTIVSLDDVLSIDKTWATATVVTANRDERFIDRLVFQLVGDQWLIDSWTPIEESIGTPTV